MAQSTGSKGFKGFIARSRNSLIIQAINNFNQHGGMIAAGNMAFLAMLALFPFLIFLVSLAGFLGRTGDGSTAIALFLQSVPPEVSSAITGPILAILDNTRGDLLTGSVVMAVWTAASGVEAARGAVIHAYGWEHGRPIWRRRLESMAVVIIAALLAIIAVAVQALGPGILQAVNSLYDVSDAVGHLWGLIHFWIVPFILFVAIWVLYIALSPRLRGYRRKRLPGTCVVLIVWMGTAFAFSRFIANAGSYDATYGSLAGVVVTQIFCFIIALGFVFGAELNAEATRRRPRAEGEAEPPQGILEFADDYDKLPD